MELHQLFIVLLDISGYTQFIKRHRTSLLHAERIISALMESVVDKSEYPLQLNKLEGDAALLYAISDGSSAAARDILGQVRRAFDAFYKRQAGLVEHNTCPCDACTRIQTLDLKAILHHGEAAIKKFRRFEELAGENVILAHRLLKNSVARKEYVLMSDPFFRLLGGLPGEALESRTEQAEGLGSVKVFVQYPNHNEHAPEVQAPQGKPGMLTFAQSAGLLAHMLLRWLGLRKAAFRNLPA